MGKMNYFFAAIAVAALTSACAKDLTTTDAARVANENDFAQDQAANGSYTGKFLAGLAIGQGAYWGPMRWTIDTQEQPVATTTPDKTAVQPVIVAEMEFVGSGGTHITISATNTYYDNSTGLFQAQLSIPRNTTPATSTVINISGYIKSGVFSGTMSAPGYESFGGNFVLNKNGTDIDAMAGNPAPSQVFNQENFTGNANFTVAGTTVTKPVDLALVKSAPSSQEEFATLVAPLVTLDATLNFGNGASIQFENGLLDRSTGILTGDTDLVEAGSTTPVGHVSLLCHIDPATQGYSCSLSTSVDTVANITTTPAPNNIAQSPDSPTRAPTTVSYLGSGLWQSLDANSLVPPETVSTSITIIYDAKTRSQEIAQYLFPVAEQTVHVSIVIGEGIESALPTVLWDVNNNALNGSQTVTDSNQTATISLNCQNFTFNLHGAYDFSCDYLSGLNDQHGTLTFKGTLP